MKNKTQKTEPPRACGDCVYENACRMWCCGNTISAQSASRCPYYTTVKDSPAYLCGVLDERARKKSNADRIRSMSDKELCDYWLECRCMCDWCIHREHCDDWDEPDATRCENGVLTWLQRPVKED